MIRKIEENELDLIEPILTKYSQETDSGVPPNFMDSVKTSVKEGKAFLYGVFSDSDDLEGIGLFGNVSKRLSFIYANNTSDLEIALVDTIFKNHSSNNSRLQAGGPWVTNAISKHLVKLGFKKLDRASMTLSRSAIETLEIPSLAKDMNFEVYDNSQIDELSQIIFKGNDNHVDQLVFPMFFGNVNDCKTLVEAIEKSVYGEYRKPYSWLLKKNSHIIGACFMTILKTGDTGYIPDIVIDPEYQGTGLGKALIVHSMKELADGESDIAKIDLDVTLENNAKFLYSSLGYKTVREYSIYTWLNKENN